MGYLHGPKGAFKYKVEWRIVMFIQGLVDIFDGLVKVVSLGFFATYLGFSWIAWYSKRNLKRMKRG